MNAGLLYPCEPLSCPCLLASTAFPSERRPRCRGRGAATSSRAAHLALQLSADDGATNVALLFETRGCWSLEELQGPGAARAPACLLRTPPLSPPSPHTARRPPAVAAGPGRPLSTASFVPLNCRGQVYRLLDYLERDAGRGGGMLDL